MLDVIPLFVATFGLSGAAFGTLAAGALGAGAAIYGANKQDKSNQAAQAQNTQQQEQQNAAAWANYLMTRGVNPNGVATGQIPTNPQAINSRLPYWATASFARPGAKMVWRKAGAGTPQGTLTRTASPVQSLPYSGGYPSYPIELPSYLPQQPV